VHLLAHRVQTAFRRWPVVIGILVVVLLAAASWSPALTALAQEQLDAGLKRALVSFGTARALNAVLSVLQGTEVSAQPLGIGLTLSLGQVLEPVNHIVEQFASLMLFASVALGVEKAVVAIGAWWPVSVALSISAAAWSVALWRGAVPSWLARLLVLLLLVRYAIPICVLGTDLLFQQFLQQHYSISQQALEEAPRRVQGIDGAAGPAQPEMGIVDRIRGAAMAPVKEVKQRYEAIQRAAEQAIERIIQLMVVFVLQTILLPLLLLWALVRSTRSLPKIFQ
jgi:hypothetical protein